MKNLLALFLMIILFESIASAQPCNLSVDAGPDQTLCIDEGTTVLNGTFSGSPINFYWTPSTGLNNPNSQTPIATLSGNITYTFNVQALDNTNLFFNGDFESGNSGFNSDYSFVDPSDPLGLAFPGSYSITLSPDIVLDNVPPCDDHTFGNGTGNQMVVNGDGTIGEDIWCQTVSVTPNTEYYASAWMTNYNLLNTPTVQFAVNGSLIGNPFSNGGLCSWQPFEASFNSGSATVVEICLINQWAGSGLLMNDFGLDDFSLTAVCTETDDINLTILDPEASIAPPLVIDCNSPLPCISLEGFSNNINGTVDYQWTASNGGIINSGATTATPEVCSAGTYTLQLSESLNGVTCLALPVSTTVSSNQLPPPTPIINGSPVVCEDDIATFEILNDLAYININWIPPSEATIISGQGTNEVTIDFTGGISDQLCVIVENNCGILNQACMDIMIQGDPLLPVISGDNQVCGNDTLALYSLDNLEPGNLVGGWTVPNDAIIVSGDETEMLLVNWANSLGGEVCVDVIGLCGVSQECYDVMVFPQMDTTFVYNTSCNPNEVGTEETLLQNQAGCDSLIITTTTFSQSDTTNISAMSCDPNEVGIEETLLQNQAGCDSLIITTTTFSQRDTTNISAMSCDPNEVGTEEILLQNQAGCDSLIITTTTLSQSDTTNISTTTCDPNEVGIEETLLQNQAGCDSLIITTTTLSQSDTTNISTTTCDPNEVGIEEILLQNQTGCDSLIITTTTLSQSDTTNISTTTCDPNEVGIEEILLQNQTGCDSLIITTTTLSQSDTTSISAMSCDPNEVGIEETLLQNQAGCDSLIITTTTFSQSDTTSISAMSCDPNEVGIEETLLQNQAGCDSLIITTTTLSQSDTTNISTTTCDPNEVGTEEILLQNQAGCDSLIITTTTFSQSDTTSISTMSCDPNEVGIEEILLQNQAGCDSLIITTTTFSQSDTTSISAMSCDPNEVGIEEILLQNQAGCDSLIITTTTFSQSDTTSISAMSCDPNEVGTLEVLLQNENGCDSLLLITTSLSPIDSCSIEANVIGETINCTTNEGTLTVTVASGQGPFEYEWEEVGTTPLGSGVIDDTNQPISISALPIGDYSITITSNNGFQIVLTASIDQLDPPIISTEVTSDFSGFAVSCEEELNGEARVNIENGGQSPFQYYWSNGQTTDVITQLAAGVYSVTVTDAAGCESIEDILLTGPPSVEVNISTQDETCYGASDGFLFIDTTYGGIGPYLYSFNGSFFQNQLLYDNLPTGNYTIAVQDANGCESTAVTTLTGPPTFIVDLGPDQIIRLGEEITIEALINVLPSELDTIIWESSEVIPCPDCLSQTLKPQQTADYNLLLINENGCVAEDNLRINILKERAVYIPSAFSPNGDGINDFFTIYAGPEVVQIRQLLIFDRWGESVFKAENFQANEEQYGWNGFYRGEIVNPGVWTYWAEVEFLDGFVKLFKGDVTIIK